MDIQENLPFVRFMWDIVKQLPPLILMALAITCGLVFVWMLAQLSVWYFVGLVCAAAFIFVLAVCKAAQ
jgi:hypothetical protein